MPRIVPFDLSDEPITSGQPVTMHCSISEGDLPVDFRWAFHGKELSSQMGISILRLNARVSLLSIDSIAAGHTGNYTCTAQNSAGSVNHTATLLVQGQLVTNNHSTRLPFQPLPSFLRSIRSHELINKKKLGKLWIVKSRVEFTKNLSINC